MPCPDLEQLDCFLSGELDPSDLDSVRDHLESCDHCRLLVEELREHENALTDIRSAWKSDPASNRAPGPPPVTPGYEVVGTIHAGGQGIVYHARQESTGRDVAMKLLLQGRYATARQRRRFEREIDLASHLDHPNIVTVFDRGQTADGRPFFIMRYVTGVPLDRHAAGGSLTIPDALNLFTKICQAVRYAHQRGVIHRDLKPSNILIDEAGEPQLLDFGLAKPSDSATDAHRSMQTQSGEFIGTLAYASPEQVGGDPLAVDVRSDVYSLGVILYEMLTGRHPYPVDVTLAEIVRNIAEAPPQRPSLHRRQINLELDTILGKALAKETDRRYQSVSDLIRDLENYRAGRPIEARGDSTWYLLQKTIQRHFVPVTAAAIVMLVLLAASLVSVGFWRQAVDDRAQALQAAEDVKAALKEVELEADKVIAINRFLVDMLSSPHPVRQGRDVLVRDLLDEAARTIEESFAAQPLIEAELRRAIGDTYRALGMLDTAETHLRRAVQLHTAYLGDYHPDTLESCSSLALSLSDLGRLEESAHLARQTLDRQTELLGRAHVNTARTMSTLGLVSFQRGEYAQAESLWREAYEIDCALLGADDVSSLVVLNNLSWLQLQFGRYDEAEPLIIDALATQRRALGDEHMVTMRGMAMLALLYDRRGRFDEAEALYREVWDLRRRILGDHHPETLLIVDCLGWLYLQQERYAEAEELLLDNLESCRRVLGDEHQGTLQVMNSVAVLYDKQGRYEEALELKIHTLDVRRRVLGNDHPDTLASMNNLAAVYFELGRLDDAEPLWIETLDLRTRVLGPEHPDTLSSVANLGLLYQQQQRYREAEPLFTRALVLRRKTLGLAHPHTFNSLVNLSELYHALGRTDEVQQLLLNDLEAARDLLGIEAPRTQSTIRQLAAYYDMIDRPDDAARYRAMLLADRSGDSPD